MELAGDSYQGRIEKEGMQLSIGYHDGGTTSIFSNNKYFRGGEITM